MKPIHRTFLFRHLGAAPRPPRNRQSREYRSFEVFESRSLLAANLIAQWRADDLNLLSDGSLVTSWVDGIASKEARRDDGNPVLVKEAYGGRSVVRFNAADGDDGLKVASPANPLSAAGDYSIAVVFATNSNQLVGGNEEWFKNTGLVDASSLGFSQDWGISLNAVGQIATGLSQGFLQPSHTIYSPRSGLNDGQIHLATVTRQGGNLSVYIDDGPANSRTDVDRAARSSSLDVNFGRLSSRQNGYTGDIAEIRFFDGRLTDTEVSQLYQQIKAYYVNQAPVPVDDTYTVNEDSFLGVATANGLLVNDFDAEGDPLSVSLVDGTRHGQLALQPNGAFLYTPSNNFFGTDSFTYRVHDLQASDAVGTVTIHVAPRRDAPVPQADSYKTTPTQPLAVGPLVGLLANDLNPDLSALQVVIADNPRNGTLALERDGSFSYDPRGFAGVVTFTYRIDDGTALTSPGTVTIVVNTPPEAVSDAFNTLEDSPLDIPAVGGVLANDRDADANPLSAQVVTEPAHGTLVFRADGSFNYTPQVEFSGSDSFTYRISDGVDDSSIATVSIATTPVNDAPSVTGDSYFLLPNQPLSVTAEFGVLANDRDIDGPTLQAILVSPPAHGELRLQPDGGFAYVPAPGFLGTDTFTYKVTDTRIDSSPSTVRLQVATRPVEIHEVMASNADTLTTIVRATPESEFQGEVLAPDWFELHNLLNQAIDIGNWYASDDADNFKRWQFPAGTVIPAGGYLVVFASGRDIKNPTLDRNGYLHTNFELSGDGDFLALASVDGNVIDQFNPGFPQLRTHLSYGVDGTNSNQKGYFLTPTPLAANGASLAGLVDDVDFSVERGFHDTPFSLRMTTETASAIIRYTTDGTVPTTETGQVYSTPLTIGQTSIIRAAAFREGLVPSLVATQSYFFVADIVNQNQQSTIAAGFPERWRNTVADYGLDSQDQFPRIAGDTSMSVDQAKQVIADSLRSIPSLSIVMDIDDMFGAQGIYASPTSSGKRWERPTSVELVHPDGTPGFQIDAGIRIQGGAFRDFGLTKKKSFRLLFKDTYGPGKLQYPLFGVDAVDEFDTLTLRMEANDGWQWGDAQGQPQYARDEYLRRVQLAMRQPSPHGTGMHLYINGFYWGIYNVTERPDQSFGAAYFGSEKYAWDGMNSGTATNAEGDAFRSNRTRTAWRTMDGLATQIRSAATQEEKTDLLMLIQGLNPDGSDNPELEDFLDLENMIDYLIVNYYGHNSDWPQKNYYVGRENSPDSTGFKFFMWDAEWSLLLRSAVNGNNISDNAGVAGPFQKLRTSDEFRMLFADRVHKHLFNGGVFYVDPQNPAWDPAHPERNRPAAMYTEYVNDIHDALIAESARWGDQHRNVPYTRDVEWQREFDRLMTSWFPQRTANLLRIFKTGRLYPNVDAVTFSQRGGTIGSDVPITLSALAGTIYYTLDGGDPRMRGGAVDPRAVAYNSPIRLSANASIRARVLSNGEWSAIDEASFVVDAIPATAANLRISEIHFNPGIANETEVAAGFTDNDDFEFIELVNISSSRIDLTNVQLQQIVANGQIEGVKFDFASGQVRQLEPGRQVLVVENLDAFRLRYGNNLPLAGAWEGALSNGGETVSLGSDGTLFQRVAYSGAWYAAADGDGSSLEIVQAASNDLESWNRSTSWRASPRYGGSPGFDGVVLPGDTDGNGRFDANDLARAFAAGEYEDGIPGNSTFAEGDWNGDGDFNTADLVFAFMEGTFVLEAVAAARAPAVSPAVIRATFEQVGAGCRTIVREDDQPVECVATVQDRRRGIARDVDATFAEWSGVFDQPSDRRLTSRNKVDGGDAVNTD